jgi:hypothetical protein
MVVGTPATAQGGSCPATDLTSGLLSPIGIVQSNTGNLIVSETGTRVPNSGRISILGLDGARRTLLSGLPQGINAAGGDPSGPAGIAMRGRTIYVAIGQGDTVIPGSTPGTVIPNPTPASPIFSSILAIQLSAQAERITQGFTLSPADQTALFNGQEVRLSNGGGDKIAVKLVANFPDYVLDPTVPGGVVNSNPFGVAIVADLLYVTNGGLNLVWEVDVNSGAFSEVASFPPVSNPSFPGVGGPTLQAVPTGITYSGGQLLVALLRGFPFPAGASQVQAVDPETGAQTPFFTGLKTAIAVLPIRERNDTDYLVLENTSAAFPAPFPFGSGGKLVRFNAPGGTSTVVADCLKRPTSMVLDERTNTLFVTELITGKVRSIPLD